MYKNNKRHIICSVIIIILLTTFVILSNVEIKKFSFAEGIINKIVMPVQNCFVYIKNKISGNTQFFTNIDTLKTENAQLSEKVNSLEESLRELEIIKAENKILREYSNMTDKYQEYVTVPAYIISKDISNLNEIFVINVGTDNGVNANMAVVCKDGLVGYIVSSTNSTSKVKPIIEISNSTSAITSVSRDNVIIKGMLNESQRLKVTYIATDAKLVVGETVETSGIGGIYPKGLLIGTISEIIEAPNITERYAIIETAVDFSKLETVLVIKQ